MKKSESATRQQVTRTTPEPIADPDTIFPSTIEQPSFLDDVPVMTFEREPGKATFVHDKNKQLSLFE